MHMKHVTRLYICIRQIRTHQKRFGEAHIGAILKTSLHIEHVRYQYVCAISMCTLVHSSKLLYMPQNCSICLKTILKTALYASI